MKTRTPQPAVDSHTAAAAGPLAADSSFVLGVSVDPALLPAAAGLASSVLAVSASLPETGPHASAAAVAPASLMPVPTAGGPLPMLDPVATPIVSVADIVVGEDDGYVDLVVRLSAPGINTVSVAYRTYDGAAIDYGNADYAYTNGTLTFASGETEKTVRVLLTNDLVAEGLEHFYFVLSSPTNSSLGQAIGNITVIDNDSVVGTPQLFVHDVVVDEKAGTATFVVTLGATGGQSSSDAVSVNYATANGTAVSGSDYTARSGTLNFAPGEAVKTVVVNITDDTAAETFERFGLNLSGASGASIVDGNALATIGANDATAVALPRISVSDIVVGEDDGWVDVVISLSAPGQNVVTVNYDTVDGLADDYYRDYFNAAGTLKFAIGETTKVVRVFLSEDSTAEVPEHFYFTLNTPANAIIGQSYAMVTVADNEAVVSNPGVFVRDVVVDEKAGTASFVVMLGLNGGQSSSSIVTVDYATASGTATAGGDFVAQNGKLTFAAGESVKTVVVDITDDSTAESLERFGLNLSNATGGAVIVDGNATGEIGKSDATAVAQPRISVSDIVVGEDDGYVDIVVSLSAPGQSVVTVKYDTVDGLADDYYRDYFNATSTLNFAIGETTKTVRVMLPEGSDAEQLQQFYFTLDTPTNATIGQSYSMVTMVDNDSVVDAPGVFVRDMVVDEKAGTASFVVMLGLNGGQSSNSEIKVNYATASGTATAGSDFIAQSGTLKFAPGESVKTVVVDITDDSAAESLERFGLKLSNASGGAVIVDGNATGEIGRNDATAVAQPRISVSDIVVGEDDGYVDIVVSLSAPGQSAVSVKYDTVDGLADDYYRDYFNATSTLNFAIGETTKVVRVMLPEGVDAEQLQQFYFTLNTPTNAIISQTGAMVTMVDNDNVVDAPGVFVRDVVVDEKAGTASFVVMLGLNGGQSSNSEITVDYATASGTATAGSDFVAQSGTLTFAPGEAVKTVVVDITDDSTAEGPERFGLNLSNATGGAVIVDGQAIGEIGRNDATAVAQPRISVSDIVIGEDDGYVDIVVSLSAPGQSVVTVNFDTVDGLADDYYRDYFNAAGTLNFAVGETTKVVRVMLPEDGVAEPLQQFYFTLNTPVNATIVKSSAMVTMVDNDNVVDAPGVFVRDVVVDEKAGTASFVIMLGLNGGQSSNSEITVDYATASGTATAGSDFVAQSGTLTFAPGEAVKTVRVDITDDSTAEGLERFGLNLSNAIGGAVIVDGKALGEIGGNDATAVSQPRIAVTNMVVGEDDGYVDIVVSLSAPGQNNVTVNFGTADATADNYGAQDYYGASGTLNFVAGETSKVVRVQLGDNGVAEGLEHFRFNLGSPTNATIAQASAMVSVVDNDTVVDSAGLYVRDVVVDEKAGTATFLVWLGQGGGESSNETVTVDFATASGSATSGSDFTATSGRLTFAPGESLKTVVVDITDDSSAEGNQRFGLTLSDAVNASIVDGAGTGVIVANDAAAALTPLISAGEMTVAEGDGFVDVVVRLSAPSAGNVSVNYSTSDGTAQSYYRDYIGVSGVLNFAAGETAKVVRIELPDDGATEALEAFRFNLSAAVGATLGNTYSTVSIVDDDTVDVNVYSFGIGDDIYTIVATSDIVVESFDGGLDLALASVDWTLNAEVENLTLTGSAALDGTGNASHNLITGNSAANTLTGLAGNDTLDGGSGSDALIGGTGNDTYVLSGSGDAITELDGQGSDSVRAGFTTTLGTHLENLLLTGSSAINGTGNSGANKITGNSANNVLTGGSGADTLTGGDGNDTYGVDNTGDLVVEEADGGTDTVNASASHVLADDVERLTLTGTGNINATGNSGNNLLTGNAGNNLIDGGSGNDTMTGGAGNDSYTVSALGDSIAEDSGGGTDTVKTALTYTLGAELENLVLTGSSAVDGTGNSKSNALTGNSAANELAGGSGNDSLNGGAGNDTLVGGSGNDSYVVDAAGDVIVEDAGGGTDTVSTAASHVLAAEVENLVLTGSADAGATGNALVNSLTGNSGNNTLDGGSGADTMSGGAGNDSYLVQNGADVIVEAAGGGTDSVSTSVSYTLSAEIESLVLTGTNNSTLTGNSLANTITGNGGNNKLDGGSGADTMSGGAGNDSYVVQNGADVIVEAAGGGTDSVSTSVSYVLSAEVESLVLTGTNNSTLTGNSLANTITGNGGNNKLDGGSGADTMSGGAGNDSYVVQNGADVIVEAAGGGTDSVSTSVSYVLSAEIESLVLTGTNNSTLTGNSLANQITGNDGNNVLDGGSNADTLTGGAGNDSYFVQNSGDIVVEAASGGSDSVSASISYTLTSEVEKLTLTGSSDLSGTGNSKNNTLTGNSGDNALNGSSGSDTLTGGAGNDALAGGSSGDSFVLNSLLGSDTIGDFATGSDVVRVLQSGIEVGDGDSTVDGAVRLAGPGGFSAAAELVIFSANIAGSITTSSAAAAIGSAGSAYAVDRTALFVVDNGSSSALFLFSADNANALVSASELTLLASFNAAPSLAVADFVFGA